MESGYYQYDEARDEGIAAPAEESMVPDARSVLTPSEMVDSKLETMLQHSAVMVSRLQRAAGRRPAGASAPR